MPVSESGTPVHLRVCFFPDRGNHNVQPTRPRRLQQEERKPSIPRD